MWIRVGLCGALLLGASALSSRSGADEDAEAVRALRAGDGVVVTATATDTFERQRTQKSGRRSFRTVTEECPEYSYRRPDDERGTGRRTYREYDQCDDVQRGDTLELIYDPARPSTVFNNTDSWLATQEREGTVTVGLRIAGWAIVGLAGLGLVLRLRRRFTRRSSPA